MHIDANAGCGKAATITFPSGIYTQVKVEVRSKLIPVCRPNNS